MQRTFNFVRMKEKEEDKKAKRKKTGGRKAGTPNKATAAVREIIGGVLDEYFSSKLFKQDLADMEPKDRVSAMEKLAAFAIPKLQATSLDVVSETKLTIEDRLISLSEEE